MKTIHFAASLMRLYGYCQAGRTDREKVAYILSDIIRLHMDRHLVHKGASQMQVMSSQVPQTNLFSPKVSCGT